MRCPSCQSENREGRRFCAGCGASLLPPCPACGFSNLPGERFCGGCGADLPGTPAAAPAPEPLQPELRPATVLFADLVGFTSLSNRLEPEAVRSWLDRFFESADAEVVRVGGSVDKHIGDALMAVFGAPIAHDNDPERAGSCADALHGLGLPSPEPGGAPPLLHIGIATGTVMASPSGSSLHRSYTVTGPAVNLAARLCEMAKPGETLVSGPTARALAESFDCEPVGAIDVAGFEAPVPTWRMRRRKERSGHRPTPLIGRVRETRQIAGILEASLESRTGQIVVLRGEAGIGKSRLVEAAEEIARERGFASAKASVLDFGGGRERDPTRVLVSALLDLAPSAGQPERAERLQKALGKGLVASSDEAAFADLLDLPLAEGARRLYDAMPAAIRSQAVERLLAALVRTAGEDRPRLLAVEDVHWADQAMLSRIAAVGLAAAKSPCVLLLTTRIAGDPLDSAWRTRLRGTPIATVDLAPLSAADGLALAGALHGRSGPDFTALVERADGNPLFLVQLVRHADESLSSALPSSIQSLVLARADRLPPEQKRLLQTAAVLGQRFAPEAVGHLCEQPAAELGTLVAHGLMVPAGSDVAFAHALVHEAIYASLPRARREALHRRAAEWYASRDVALRAQHLGRAADPGAASAYLEAIAAARGAYRLEEALKLADEAIQAAGSERLHSALHAERGSLLVDLGRIGEATAAYQSALAAAPDPAERCRAQIGIAAAMRISDRIDEALPILDAAETTAAALGLDAERSRIHYLRGSLYFPRGRVQESRAEQERALEFARRIGSREAEALALSGLGDALYAEGRMKSAAEAFASCVELAREHGFGRIELANLPMLGFTQLLTGELRPALEIGRTAVASARRVGARRGEIIAHHLLATAHLELNELDEASKAVERSHIAALELKARRFEAESTIFKAQLARIAGDRTTALARAREALAIARETGIDYIGGLILGELAAASDDEAERRATIEEALALMARGGISHNHMWFYRTSIESDLERGDRRMLTRWADGLEAVTREEPLSYTKLIIRLARLVADQDPEAAGEIREIAAEFDTLGFVRLAQIARRHA